MTTPLYDLVLFGATGFTGRQAAEYLARHPDRQRFRFAIAGRSEFRLQALADKVAADGVIVADGEDAEAIDRMVDQARVVATTAGPFARFGDELVRSCAERGVHYADITGETPWVRTLIDRFHDRAATSGARIVPCCGYDSVPSDLGTWWIVQQLRQRHREGCREVKAFHRARGGVNGGTLASMINLQKEGRLRELADPFLLNPEGCRDAGPRDLDPTLPYFEKEVGAWVAPFLMGPINTRVVRRSHALLAENGGGYGANFRYQEYWKSGTFLGMLESGSLAAAQAAGALFAGSRWFGRALERFVPGPGTGPSKATMDRGSFECHLVATSASGAKVRGRLAGQGDPGNRITVKCLGESALALALDRDSLPATGGGLLTPATALGGALVERLTQAGIEFRLQSSPEA